VVLARAISLRLDAVGLTAAIHDSLDELRSRTRGTAGVIAIDRRELLACQLTPTMRSRGSTELAVPAWRSWKLDEPVRRPALSRKSFAIAIG
jgi:hypothetical protein